MSLSYGAGRSIERPASFMRPGRVLVCLCLLGVTALNVADAASGGDGGFRVYNMRRLDVNRWSCPFYNDGRFGIDLGAGRGSADGTWPQPLHNTYIFGAGLWFGSLAQNPEDSTVVDTLVSFSYNPTSYGNEMTPTLSAYAHAGAIDPADRMFAYPDDWPPSPRSRFIIGRGTDSLVPTDNVSLQDLWCVYSDAAPQNHVPPGRPQRIDVFQAVYAWDYPLSQDAFFISYRVRNSGRDTLRRCYVGAVIDADIGNPADDMVGYIDSAYVPGVGVVRGLGFAGDVDNVEGRSSNWEAGTPGAIGYQFLASPTGPSGEPLGMTAFKRFTRDIDPNRDATQYLTMAGFDYRTNRYLPYDSVDLRPGDKRFIQCSGPFDLAPGQVERLTVACIVAPYGGPGQAWSERGTDSLTHLARVATDARFVHDQGWLLPGPPETPGVTLVPGDNRVRIVWDDLPERTVDEYWEKVASDTANQGYDPMYRGDDFEGYIVYRSRDGAEWNILAQFDKVDSIMFEYPPAGDSSIADSLWIEAEDTGVSYSLLDDNVVNGYTYYYAVSAYDWNYVTTEWDTTRVPPVPIAWDTLILRTGIRARPTIPRWDPVNYWQPLTEVRTVVGDTVNPGLAVTSTVVIPFEVTTTPYRLHFLGPEYVGTSRTEYRYFVTDPDGELTVDTTAFTYAVGDAASLSVPVFNGQELALALDVRIPGRGFDTAYVVTGTYPPEKIRPAASVTQQALWAFRGSDYRIVWTTMEGSGELTAKVYDVTKGDAEVSYSPFTTPGQGPRNANGWCFADRVYRNPTDTLKTSVAQMFICGGFVSLNFNEESQRGDTLGSMMSSIQAGDTWMVLGHKEEGTAPMYNEYELVSTPGSEDLDSTWTLNVKVVPNPYIVFDEWEASSENRMVKFTHLPMTCTIRIFTLSGDLVRTLEHTSDGDQPHDDGGTESWNCRSAHNILVAPGVYVYHVASDAGEFAGKLVLVH